MKATFKWSIVEMLKNPPECFKDVIQEHFSLRIDEVRKQCYKWFDKMLAKVNDYFTPYHLPLLYCRFLIFKKFLME
jgi:hypothetical protein